MATWIVGAVVLLALAGAVWAGIRQKKKGAGCGHGCAGCPNAGCCHPQK